MGRPRKYATNAEKQAAYRDRRLNASVARAVKQIAEGRGIDGGAKKQSCSAYVPSGTKCKFCGKTHA